MSEQTHQRQFLVLDQGGHASRAMIVDDCGRIISKHQIAIEARRLPGERVEYDGEAVVKSLRQVAGQALADLPPKQQLAAAGMATQRSNIVCWDRRTGDPLSPVLSWQDRRTGNMLAQWQEHSTEIHAQTGLYLSAHYGASKLRWCLEEVPDVRAARIDNRLVCGPMSSYLTCSLLEEKPIVADPANASRTLLWSIQQQDWSSVLLDVFDIPRRVLPECVTTDYAFGTFNLAGRRIPMAVVTGDQSASLYATGLPESCTAYITVGTGAFIQCFSAKRPVVSDSLLTSVVFSDDDGPDYCLEGTVNGAGSALSAARKDLGMGSTDDLLPHWLEEITDPPVYLNGISGLGTPYLGRSIESRYVGSGNEQARIVAVIESMIFLIQQNLHVMAQCLGRLNGIVIGGGLSQLDGFCQRLADLSGYRVKRCRESETTCIGVAYLLNRKPAGWPVRNHIDLFQPHNNVPLERRYRRWRELLLDALK